MLSSHSHTKRLLRSLLFLTLVQPLAALGQPVSATVAQWQSDIDFLGTQLPKVHPNLFGHVSQADFNAALAVVKNDVPTLTDAEIAIRLQQVVAMVRDGHTSVDTSHHGPRTFYPFLTAVFTDGLFVIRATGEAAPACGARLVAVEGMPIENVAPLVASVISFENDQWVLAEFPLTFARAEVLQVLGVTPTNRQARFTFERSGVPFDLVLHPVDPVSSGILLPPAMTDGWPLYLHDGQKNYWYSWDPVSGLLYIKYNVCESDPARPFPAFASEVLGIVDSSLVRRVVVDVRNNGGGSSSVAQPLINGLQARASVRGKLFAIIGRETFSSGLLNSFDLQRAGAVLAGEPTGGKPNAYGEVQTLFLPNTQLPVNHSTKLFTLVAGSDPSSLFPDVMVQASSYDFFAQRDPVLDAITSPPNQSGKATNSTPGKRRAVAPPRARMCLF